MHRTLLEKKARSARHKKILAQFRKSAWLHGITKTETDDMPTRLTLPIVGRDKRIISERRSRNRFISSFGEIMDFSADHHGIVARL